MDILLGAVQQPNKLHYGPNSESLNQYSIRKDCEILQRLLRRPAKQGIQHTALLLKKNNAGVAAVTVTTRWKTHHRLAFLSLSNYTAANEISFKTCLDEARPNKSGW